MLQPRHFRVDGICAKELIEMTLNEVPELSHVRRSISVFVRPLQDHSRFNLGLRRTLRDLDLLLRLLKSLRRTDFEI